MIEEQTELERFEAAITGKIAAETRIIELEAQIVEKDSRIEELKGEVEKSLLFVAKAEKDRMMMFSSFLLLLTGEEKQAIKASLIREFGLKE